MIWLIIYLVGVIATWILIPYYFIEEEEGYIDVGDIVYTLFHSLFSWLTFIIFVFVLFSDKVVYRKKK